MKERIFYRILDKACSEHFCQRYSTLFVHVGPLNLIFLSGLLFVHGKKNLYRVGGAHIAPGTCETELFGLFAVTRDGKVIISGGHWDSSIRCSLISEAGRPRQVSDVKKVDMKRNSNGTLT